MRGIDRDLIARGIAVPDAEVVILEVDVEVRMNQFLFDAGPDYAGHFIPVHLDQRMLDFDFCHCQWIGSTAWPRQFHIR